MTKKHGNNRFWCFLEDNWDTNKPIEVWQSLGDGNEEVMAHATDRYNATKIVNSLITAENVRDNPTAKLPKKAIVFLQFVSANCNEPWTTMAANAIMWNDQSEYEKLKAKFGEFY